MNTQNVNIGPVSSRSVNAPTVSEPTMLGVATELLNYVSTLESHSEQLRSVLFGEGECGLQHVPPTTLQGLLLEACQRTASLCGELATIKNRLGITVPVQ